MTPLTCQIKGLAQDMDLETGKMTTALVLRLSNGETIKATIEESVAEKVLGLSAQVTNAPSEEERQTRQADPEPLQNGYVMTTPSVDMVEVFGGTSAPPQEERQPERLPAPPVRKQAVAKDSYGYPIVPQQPPTDTEGLEDEEGGI
jgi:hypothetical protein